MSRSRHPAVSALATLRERIAGVMPDNVAAQRMGVEVSRLFKQLEALDRMNANRSELDTEAAHTKKVADAARKLDKEITACLNRALVAMSDGVDDAQRRINEKVNLTPHRQQDAICAAFRGMSGKAQAKQLQELIEENRGDELGAILNAPPILTGLTREQAAQYKRAVFAKHAAAELDEQSMLQGELLETVSTAVRAAGDFTKELFNPERLAAIEASDAAARAAGDAFSQAIAQQ